MPSLDLDRTIVAVSSGLAPAHRAIIRLSGSATSEILRRVIVGPHDELEATQPISFAADCRLGDSQRPVWSGRSISTRIYFWPDQRCYTGEPSAEIHLLGALPIVESLIDHLVSLGAAPADRGEFTLRSFLAGKLDLTQAEAVLGVIEADGDTELKWALGQLAGNISVPVRELRQSVIDLLAHLEAGLDFVEEDIEFVTGDELARDLQAISQHLSALSAQLRTRGVRTRTIQVVLMGPPNAGKSSLFNALLGHDRAIISPRAGTTRDALSEELQLEGLGVELVDTAGAEELHGDSPRAQAQHVLEERLQQADLVLLCVDLSNPTEAEACRSLYQRLQRKQVASLIVGTKSDLTVAQERLTHRSVVREPRSCTKAQGTPLPIDISVSINERTSVDLLRQRLAIVMANLRRTAHSDAMHRTMIRCQRSIDLAQEAVDRALELVELGEGEELIASELRIALEDLSAVIGEVHNEDILGEIFSRFCIGK